MTDFNILEEVLKELKEEVPKLAPVGIYKKGFQVESNNTIVAQLNTVIKLLLIGNNSLHLYNQKLEELNNRVRNLELILPSLESIKTDPSNSNLIARSSDLEIFKFLTKIENDITKIRAENILERDKREKATNLENLDINKTDKGKEKVIYHNIKKEPIDYKNIIGPIKIIKK